MMLESIGDYGIPEKDQKYSECVDTSFADHISKNSVMHYVGQEIEGKEVMDFGCGDGHLTVDFALTYKPKKIYGLTLF
jgi:predicted RNA methylase